MKSVIGHKTGHILFIGAEADFYSLLTCLNSNKSAKRFGKAINPLNMSDIVHMLSALNIAPSEAVKEKVKANMAAFLLLKRYLKAVSPQ